MACFHFKTDRLLLRPLQPADAPAIAAQIGDYDVAKNLSTVPYPYVLYDAEDFIARMEEKRASGSDFVFAILRTEDNALMGCIGLHLKEGFFEFGYWLGRAHWGQGYASEAARKLAGFAFGELKAEKLVAGWFHDNPASGHVLEKLGAVPNGVETRDCLARGHAVQCNMMVLARENFGRKKVAA